jgi:hypothetical protein
LYNTTCPASKILIFDNLNGNDHSINHTNNSQYICNSQFSTAYFDQTINNNQPLTQSSQIINSSQSQSSQMINSSQSQSSQISSINNSRVSTAFTNQTLNNIEPLAQSSQISSINYTREYSFSTEQIRINSQSSNLNLNNTNHYNIVHPTQSSHVPNIQNNRRSTAPRCQCGSSTHSRISHSDCKLNKKKRRMEPSSNNEINNFIENLNIQNPSFVFLNQSEISNEQVNDFVNSLNIQNPTFGYSQSDFTNHQANEFLDTLNENFTDDIPVYRVLRCRCGSTEHLRITHRDCILNKRIVNANNRTLPVAGRCQCGSDKHVRISHSDCPLNPKRPQNSQGNQIESIEDYDDFINSNTQLENHNTSTLETV